MLLLHDNVGVQTPKWHCKVDCAIQCSLLPAPPLKSGFCSAETDDLDTEDDNWTEDESEDYIPEGEISESDG